MKEYVESRGAVFLVVHWDQQRPTDRLSSDGAPLFRGTIENLIETGVDPPPGWPDWMIPGDDHPDARAHAWVADLVRTRLAALGIRLD
jgi:hypothetical protein